MRKSRRATTGRLGQTMVEFALGLPVLLLLLVGVVEMSRMILAYNVVNNVAREGALYAAATTTIAPPPLPGTLPTGANPNQPTWWQPCNVGQNVRLPPPADGYIEYPATDARCVGWANVVSAVTRKAQGIDPARALVRISYDRPAAAGPGEPLPAALEGYNRGVPVMVVVEYRHYPLATRLLGIPAMVTLTGSSTATTQ
jgi:Flp pilus assembly protein TadG